MDVIGAAEAKAHLSRLLDEVAAGRSFTITKHGAPIARLLPASLASARPEEVIRELRKFRHGITTGGISIRAMIEDGRR